MGNCWAAARGSLHLQPPSALEFPFENEAPDCIRGGWAGPFLWDPNYRSGSYHNHNGVMSSANVHLGGGTLTPHAEYGTPAWAKATHTHGGVTRDINFNLGSGKLQ